MRFNKSSEKSDGISFNNTVFLLVILAVIAKTWDLIQKYSYLLDKLTLSDSTMLRRIGSVLILLVCVAIVEYRRKKMIEKHGHYVPKTIMEKVVTLAIDYIICAVDFIQRQVCLLQEQVRAEKRKKLIAKLEAWDARVEEYNRTQEITGGELYEQE